VKEEPAAEAGGPRVAPAAASKRLRQAEAQQLYRAREKARLLGLGRAGALRYHPSTSY
jgi:hypothetical protein